MKRSSPSVSALAALLLTMTCGGCVTSGAPELKVNLPAECERNAKPVAAPAFKIGDQALSILARYRAALGLANRRIVAVAACETKVRELFAKSAATQ